MNTMNTMNTMNNNVNNTNAMHTTMNILENNTSYETD